MRLTAFLSIPAASFLRYAFSLGLLAWVFSRVDWADLHLLREVEWAVALPAVLLAGLAYPVQAWRWHVLLRAQGLELPARWVHRVFWIGQFYNSFLPGGVAGDAVRFAHLWREQPQRKATAAAGLLADRLLGLAALFALAALALGLHVGIGRGTAGLESLFAGSVTAFALVLAAGWSATRTRWWEPLSARLLGPGRAEALHDAAIALGREHRALALASGLSIAVWLLDFAAVWLLAQSVGLPAGPLTMTVAAAAAYVAATLPISIGGHGVREGALVMTLGLLGVTAGPRHLLALAFWAVSVGWSLLGGVIHLLPSGGSKADS